MPGRTAAVAAGRAAIAYAAQAVGVVPAQGALRQIVHHEHVRRGRQQDESGDGLHIPAKAPPAPASARRHGSKVRGDPEDAAELRHVVPIAFRWFVSLVEVDLLFGGQARDGRPLDGARHEAHGGIDERTLRIG